MISADLLLHAYRQSAFPMAMDDGEIAWFSPDPRAIVPLDSFHVPLLHLQRGDMRIVFPERGAGSSDIGHELIWITRVQIAASTEAGVRSARR